MFERFSFTGVANYLVLHHYRNMIGLKRNSCRFFIQSETRPKLIVTRLLMFGPLSLCNYSSFEWFIGLSVSFVIGWSDNFNFGLASHK